MLRMGEWGPAEAALREVRSAEALAAGRRLLVGGNLRGAAEEVLKLLEAEDGISGGSFPGAVAAQLGRFGWALRLRASKRVLAFRVEGPSGSPGDLVLDGGAEAACREGGSVLPAFHPKARPRPGLAPRQARGLSELAAALGLLLESLRGRDGREGPAKAEHHEEAYGDRRLFRVTFACNQRCPFCFIPVSRRRAEPGQLERELDRLAAELKPGAELTISGGEPLVEPRLPEILARARRKGVRRFVLQTNAVGLARPGLARRLVGLGVGAGLVSFHSHRPEVYDRLTGSRGQFPRAVRGLSRLLACAKCAVTINVVVTALNYRELPDLMRFFGALSSGPGPGRRPGVYFSMMNGAGHHQAPWLAVTLKDAAPYLRRALRACRGEGLKVELFGGESSFPVCLLERPRDHAARRNFSQHRMRYAEDFSGELGGVGRAKRPECRGCPFDPRCLGVPAEYARMFGLGDLPSGSEVRA